MEDAGVIVKWRNGQKEPFFLNNEDISMESHLRWFSGYLHDSARFDFVIIRKEGFIKIGTIGIKNIKDSTCELSYFIGEISERRKGYAREAVGAMMAQAGVLDIYDIYATIHKNNIDSTKLAAYFGFAVDHQKGDYCVYKKKLRSIQGPKAYTSLK